MVSSDVRSVDDVLSRNDEDMRRRNRVQVPEGVDEIGGENLGRRDHARSDGAEEAVGHRRCRFLATVDSDRIRIEVLDVVPGDAGPLAEGEEVLEAARSDAGPLDEIDDVVLLQADDASEPVRRQVTLVDEPVERSQVDTE